MSTGLLEERLRIGEVAARVGVTPRTIRYYEELGLLGASAAREKGGHRFYSEADVARLTELVRLRDLLGLTLDELAPLVEAAEARAALRDRWEGTESDTERLRIVEEALVHVSATARARPGPPRAARRVRGRARGEARAPDASPRRARRGDTGLSGRPRSAARLTLSRAIPRIGPEAGT